MDPYDIAARYGVRFTGELVGPEYHDGVDWSDGAWPLAEIAARGGTITRIRVLAERGRGDISYVHATLPDGRIVPVSIDGHPDAGMGVPMKRFTAHLVLWAKAQGVYGHRIGLLNPDCRSILW